MDEKLILVTSTGDWGDEFDLQGFAIYTNGRWENLKEGIPDEPFDAYYGSNEFVTFEDKEEYLSHIKEQEISSGDALNLVYLLTGQKLKFDDFFRKYGFSYGLFVIESTND
jgi:hypothetical protein